MTKLEELANLGKFWLDLPGKSLTFLGKDVITIQC